MWNFIWKYFSICSVIIAFTNTIFSQEDKREIKPASISVSFNGKFVYHSAGSNSKANSDNGQFWCQYDIGHVGDEVRELLQFKLFENNQLLFTLKRAPGSDVYISNSGITAFMDMKHHYKNELTIHFYSKYGQHLFSETFKGASLFGFSSKGEKFGVETATHLYVISMSDHKIEAYEKGFQFDISEDENLVAVAMRGRAKVYSKGDLLKEFKTDFLYTRKIEVSSKYNMLAVIDKRHLKVYSLADGKILFANNLKGNKSYRDIILNGGKILTGIHYHGNGLSKGILKVYDRHGKVLIEKEESIKQFKTFKKQNQLQKSSSDYGEIPWPFAPFDSMCTVWNYYEQHMGGYGADWSYLHQGLDIITPIGEPTYAVAEGIVKCVLTLGGAAYWRTAISKEQTADYSKGWLYAHLIESTIQFDVGDTVQIHDYLGDIIQWSDDWGHIHFVEIKDSGLVWQYDDNEWGITYNPLLSLQPDTDLIPPIIEKVFDNSKFGFCLNETNIYLDPDSLYGDIDIIAKVKDYVGDSSWEQPAFETYYWVKKIPEDDIVFPRTLGQILNHSYDFYASGNYEPYATLIYKRDSLLISSSWMSMQRNYYHILTNNNGDSLADLSEKELAFSTTDYPDGDYRIFVEALDEYGNSTIDSMDVKFQNGLVGVSNTWEKGLFDFQITQNHPNPFNLATRILYSIPSADFVTLKVYDVLGREIRTLISESKEGGTYSVTFDASKLATGIYFYKLQIGNYNETRKMILLR